MLESVPSCQQHMAYSAMVNCCLFCPAVDRFLPSLDAMADLLLEAPPRDQEQVGCGGWREGDESESLPYVKEWALQEG